MEPSHRGWPPPAGNTHSNGEQNNQPQSTRTTFGVGNQQSPPQNSNNLPPPQPAGPFSHFNQQPPPSLASIASISQSSPRQPQPSAGRLDGAQAQGPPQLPLPGFNQVTGPAGGIERERERERVREQEQIHIKEEEDRRREQQERQRFEQAPPHQGPPVPLHQPVAVGPRTAHGPNGLLNNPMPTAPQPQHPHLPLGAPSGPGNVFGGPVLPATQSQGPPGQQQMQPGLLMPFPPAQSVPQQQQQGQQQPPQQQGQPTQAQGQTQGQGQGQQPILNDALSYLDQVKVQFSEHPDVYNRFLDIMKDFKSGAIDTPGVIGRVSSLFAGNPDLIQGFNTFLPPGYRIECGADNDPNSIRVTTPAGVSFHKMPPVRPLSQQGDAEPFGHPNGTYTSLPGPQTATSAFSPNARPAAPSNPGQHLSPMETTRQQEQQAMHQQQERGLGSLQNAISAATGSSIRAGVSPRGTPLPGQQDASAEDQPGGLEKRPPVEFNHAINYVNKIKTRFAAHPDVYKQFLEILQTYQRESKPIQEVYSQVTKLFGQAHDLLEDFKQFLPESAAHARAAERARQQAEENAMTSNVRNEAYQSPIMSRETHLGTPNHGRVNLPPVGNFAPTPVSKDNKRKRNDRQGTAGSATEGISGPATGKAGGYSGTQVKRSKQTHAQAAGKTNDQPPLTPTLIPALPTPLLPTTTSTATNDDLQLWDRVKKHVGNKTTMNEFLKLCNLFSQDLISRSTLIHRAQAYIGGNPELSRAWMDWIGFDEKDVVIENKAREPVVPGGRVSLSNCRGLGPSYRLLPKRERVKPCSGRDELCNSVLNDEWASHPTWASEDSGFIAHRKNAYEEGLHRIEEERHDYDLNIEAASRTIQILEPFAQQLVRMSPREANAFTLPEKLGAQSDIIYKKAIMKAYGREHGARTIQDLYTIPAVVIPVVMNRLKERMGSWKLAQREWDKIWRDQTQRMFWRSLDHQNVAQKAADRRQFQAKALQAEVQIKYEEAKLVENREPGAMHGKAQMSLEVNDVDIIVDTTYLLLVYLEAQASADSPRLPGFVKDFVPSFFRIDPAEFESKLNQRLGGTPANGEAADMSGAEDSGMEKRGRKSIKGSLLRQTLDKRGRGGKKENASLSRASTPDVTSNAGDQDGADIDMADTPAAEDTNSQSGTSVEAQSARRWLDHPAERNTLSGRNVDPNEPEKRTVFRLWGNASIFCFVRMFMIVYERLLKLKCGEGECRKAVKYANMHKPATELGIMDKVPSDYFSDVSPSANFYSQMLSKFALAFEGELDFTNDVEDTLRRFYLQAGHQLYALEKLVTQMARYGMQIVSQEGGNKEKSWEIMQPWFKHVRREGVGAREMTDYRRAVEKMIGNGGDGYGIDWDDEKKMIKIFLWKRDDGYFSGEPNSARDQENRWRYYIASYTSVDNTSGIDRTQTTQTILFRNLHAMGADPKAEGFPPLGHSPRETAENAENSDATANGTSDKILTRFLAAKTSESLEMRIGVTNYLTRFDPPTAESFFMDLNEREGGEVAVKDAGETAMERADLVKDKVVLINEGMKGLSREQVGERNEEFGRLTAIGIDDDDEEMDVGQ